MQNGYYEVNAGFDTPVAMFNFNRPHLTRQVFEVVRQVRPKCLLLVADGPRADRPDDARLCAEVRAILDEIDWECTVLRNYSDTNLGSFKRNSSGLNWVFDTVEEAIILEDDCVPSLSFFPYCEELLERYRDDSRIGLISGNNFLPQSSDKQTPSYFFSIYAMTWGWASWRHTWLQVDMNMPYWPDLKDSGELSTVLGTSEEEIYWRRIYDQIRSGKRNNAWDYQLMLACIKYRQLTIVPAVNLVANVGYGVDATHCLDGESTLANNAVHKIFFPLNHPEEMMPSAKIDNLIFKTRFATGKSKILLDVPASAIGKVLKRMLPNSYWKFIQAKWRSVRKFLIMP
jgi:hypothetical protein